LALAGLTLLQMAVIPFLMQHLLAHQRVELLLMAVGMAAMARLVVLQTAVPVALITAEAATRVMVFLVRVSLAQMVLVQIAAEAEEPVAQGKPRLQTDSALPAG
jgi:hypothetical protein